ncbi:Uu.00g116300.m01.CDS01 [Anthostomella pinea]|uniref:Structural maintenance of chromosomes protein 5 n=1 Tax=Anthostomella pinea TaxID=933095 RepID=A0AAI8VGI3_9PEZI|nr:Uu.00g116300.m01.CDS01 [Anthostomella pinea]
MPSLEPRRWSRARFEEEDDEQTSGSDSSKRQRRDMDGTQSEEDGESDDETANRDVAGPSGQRRNGRASTSGQGARSGSGEFQPGAIVRVRVENFVTYEHAEFLPGPNLNMVIGPNGTGKSSLVCAICLGMGYHPKHLGRASNVGEFVKHGKDTATIEIELQKRPEEKSNHVMCVQINREDNSRKWWLNGRESTHKAVQELTRSLRIQIDNLCQFLPQDKVAEFAGLTPVQLLHETLRAAAPEKMVAYQTTLKELHKDHKTVKQEVDSCVEILKGHENRQQGLQGDVNRLRDREAIQKQIQDLQDARAVAEYNEVRNRHIQAKAKMKKAQTRLAQLQEASQPALAAVEQKRQYQAQIEPVVAARKTALKEAEAVGEQARRRIEVEEESINHVQAKKKAEDASFATKRASIAKIRKTITDLEAQLKNKPDEFVASEWNVKIRQKESILTENESQKRELNSQFDELKKANAGKKADLDKARNKQEALDSQQGQKLAHLRHVHADAAKGWEWLQDHQDQFEKEVLGPPMLTCSVTDSRYSDLIQSLLSQDDFTCFIAQTRNDHKKLSDQFYKGLKLSVSIRTCMSSFASFKPAIPVAQAHGMGLDGYAIDYLEGPEPVLAMLCAEKKLHVSGVASRDLDNAQYEKIVSAERIPSWAAGHTYYRVTRRREYGTGAMSTTTRRIQPGRFWTDQPVDSSEKAAIQKEINEITDEMATLTQEGREKKSKLKAINDSEGDVLRDIENLRKEKAELQRAATVYANLGLKISNEKQALEETLTEIQDCRKRVMRCTDEEDQRTVAKTRLVLQHKETLSTMRDAHQALLEAQIRLVEAKSDVQGLKDRNADIVQRLEDEKAGVERTKADIDSMKREATMAKQKVVEIVNEDEAKLPYLNQMADGKTTEDLDNDIGAEQSKLELIHAVDPIVLQQFEKRAKDIRNLTQQKDEKTAKLDSMTRKIETLMQKWEPVLDEVVSKINDAFGYNFEQINCAGEVGIHKDEDFEQWSIVIKVKFRENETLQQLNQHRQSGGERAVSTIFYLMALQSMAQAPFRVVDEINQGMDPRNERMVHERMVEIACREHTSQYFLITPKLLTGLRYDERMRVLCIASGEHMPPEGRKLEFRKLVRIRRAIGAAA